MESAIHAPQESIVYERQEDSTCSSSFVGLLAEYRLMVLEHEAAGRTP